MPSCIKDKVEELTRRKVLRTVLTAPMALTACGSPASTQITAVPGTKEASSTESETWAAGEQENRDTAEAETGAPGEPYRTGIVTPTLTVSEDKFRGVQEMVQRYPDLVVRKTLLEGFVTDKESCTSVATDLADGPEAKYILFNNGMEGIVSAFQTIRGKRPNIITMITGNGDPKSLDDYTDIPINTDWIRRGEITLIKAHDMRVEAFIHYSFSTHMAAENEAKRRDMMKETCEKLGMTWVGETTLDPQTGNGAAAMFQFLRENTPRKIEQCEPDTSISRTNYSMYDVILDETFKEGFIVTEQCCPTPTQAYPTVLNLGITEEDLGDYNKINNLITEKARGTGMSEGLSGWAMPSSVYIPQLQVELAKYMCDNSLSPEDVLDREPLSQFTNEHMSVAADFQTAGEGLEHYYMLLLGNIYYQDVRRL